MSSADRAFLRERVIDRVESPNQERGYFATLRSMNAFFLFFKKSEGKRIKAFQGKIDAIWGEHDIVFPLIIADPFRHLRPDAVFSVIDGAGHLPHQEKPDETAAIMLQFLGGM
jgi:pimeloyl-ACP methyl ester carboxylesterase